MAEERSGGADPLDAWTMRVWITEKTAPTIPSEVSGGGS
jgi:hypothetical protein